MASPPLYLPHSSLVEFPKPCPFGDKTQSENQVIVCSICLGPYTAPKVLPCLHSFCHACLEKIQDNLEKIQCPQCKQDCILPPQGVSGLLSDYAIRNIVEALAALEDSPIFCTCCKTDDAHAVASCFDCATYLCENCTIAHQYMYCFDGHQFFNLKEQTNKDDFKPDKFLFCTRHKKETLRFFCMTCDIPICKECANNDHPRGLHDYDYIFKVGPRQVEILGDFLEQIKTKANDLQNTAKCVEHISTHLQMQYSKAQTEISDTFDFYCSVLEERKEKLMEELDDLYNTKMDSLILKGNNIQEMVEQVQHMSLFIDRIVRYSSNSEILMFKQLLDTKLQAIMTYDPEVNMQSMDLEFLSNYHTIEFGVRKTFGCIRHNFDGNIMTIPQPIARPNGAATYDRTYRDVYAYKSNFIPKMFYSKDSFLPLSTSLNDISSYGRWSSDPTAIFQNDTASSLLNTEPVIDLTSNIVSDDRPVKSQLKRRKIIYHCKFGEFGDMQGQFAEPSGVAVNPQNDIIVADANNHRIQVFDKEGRFKFEFGKCGKLDGQLLYPNKVAVEKTSGDIIVIERSPTHQIQIYNQYGQFVRKFGAGVLQHPRAVAVDAKGLIIVVECKVMRVVIFDQFGKVLKKFSFSKRVEFPNGVVVNDYQEIFITDNKTHCVKVFNYDGVFLRHIGGESLTNYPVGVCINQNGEILVADNHNNFNITVFTPDGEVMNAFESKVKHAQCLDVALMGDGSVVLACKDYRLYIYRYTQYRNLTSSFYCCI